MLARLLSPWSSALIAGLAVVAMWLVAPPEITEEAFTDYVHYYRPLAENMFSGKGYRDMWGDVSLRYPPGYPVLLAGAFAMARGIGLSQRFGVELLNVVMFAAAGALFFLLARLLWTSGKSAICVIALVTYPPVLWLTRGPYSEIPFMAFLFGGVLLFCWGMLRRPAWWVFAASGALVGAAMLVRPIGIGVSVVLAVVLLCSRPTAVLTRRAIGAASLVLCAIAVVIPWEAWAYAQSGRVVALAENAMTSVYDGLTFNRPERGYQGSDRLPRDVRDFMNDFFENRCGLGSGREMMEFVVSQSRRYPGAAVKLLAIKTVRSWYATDSGKFENILAPLQVVWMLLVIAGLWGIIARRAMPGPVIAAIVATVACFWVTSVVCLSILRYMAPPMALLFLFLPGIVSLLPIKTRTA